MELELKELQAGDLQKYARFYTMRSNITCAGSIVGSYLWGAHFNARYDVLDDRAFIVINQVGGRPRGVLPVCADEDLPYYFKVVERYFNNDLGQRCIIGMADEAGIKKLGKIADGYDIQKNRDMDEYIYDAEKLRTLSGRAYHKKKNHVNAFLKEYDGRYEYRRLGAGDSESVWSFLVDWARDREDDKYHFLTGEMKGLRRVLDNMEYMGQISAPMGGIFIDGKLQAMSFGSYNPVDKIAIIYTEKASRDINGLYAFINQQFLIHEFPQARLVNRDDDIGIEALRAAKLSYKPIMFARKFTMTQKAFG